MSKETVGEAPASEKSACEAPASEKSACEAPASKSPASKAPIEPCRHYPMEGIANMRDLGGYACIEGVTRFGVFFRSSSLHAATKDDLERLAGLGISLMIDLRYPEEIREKPDRVPEGCGSVRFCMMGTTPLKELDVVNSSVENTRTLIRMYKRMLRTGREEIAGAFRAAAEAPGPVLFHCASGKDRTGVLAMLILSCAGAAREDILADYQMSSLYIKRFTDDVSGSNVYNMEKLLEYIDHKWGNIMGYLNYCGVQEAYIKKMRNKILGI